MARDKYKSNRRKSQKRTAKPRRYSGKKRTSNKKGKRASNKPRGKSILRLPSIEKLDTIAHLLATIPAAGAGLSYLRQKAPGTDTPYTPAPFSLPPPTPSSTSPSLLEDASDALSVSD